MDDFRSNLTSLEDMDVSENFPLVSVLFDVGRERYRKNTN